MGQIILYTEDPASIPTPSAGKVTLFIDSTTGFVSVKDSTGTVTSWGTGGGLTADPDVTLAADSDSRVATQHATRTYADAGDAATLSAAETYADTGDAATLTAAAVDASTKRDAAKAYADSLVVSLYDNRGNYDASGNVFPTTGGSGAAGAILKNDLWRISVAGTLGGTVVVVGDFVVALVDTPGSTAGNWAINNAAGVAADTNAAATKATPVDADLIPLIDSASGFGLKQLSWANLKATAKTYFDTLYLGIAATAAAATKLITARTIDGTAFDGTANITVVAPATHAAASKATPVDADELPLVDSASGNALAKLTWANLKATAKTYFDTLYAAVTHVSRHQFGGADPLETIADVGDADSAITTNIAVLPVALTAARTYTLPAANAFTKGSRCAFVDVFGSVSNTLTATLQRAGTDTVNGGTSTVLVQPYGSYIFITDGVSKWTSLGRSQAQIDVFTSSGIWTKRSWARSVTAMAISGAGSGGSGRRGAASTVRGGGAGGGGSGRSWLQWAASQLNATETVVVGAGVAGGLAQTVDSTDGNPGGLGGDSSFGTYMRARAGTTAAGGGNATGATAGGAGAGIQASGGAGGTPSPTGGVGGSGVSATYACPGAGAGGGVNASNTAQNGGPGGNINGLTTALTGGNGGVVDTTAPQQGTADTTMLSYLSSGSGGGAGSITANAQAGADGIGYGAPGGGGGGSLNGHNSGAGGAGTAGIVVVIQYQ